MGEMTIRMDDALMLALRARADVLGTEVDRLVADLLKAGLQTPAHDRSAVARAIQARSRPSHLSSVELLDQIRDEGR